MRVYVLWISNIYIYILYIYRYIYYAHIYIYIYIYIYIVYKICTYILCIYIYIVIYLFYYVNVYIYTYTCILCFMHSMHIYIYTIYIPGSTMVTACPFPNFLGSATVERKPYTSGRYYLGIANHFIRFPRMDARPFYWCGFREVFWLKSHASIGFHKSFTPLAQSLLFPRKLVVVSQPTSTRLSQKQFSTAVRGPHHP